MQIIEIILWAIFICLNAVIAGYFLMPVFLFLVHWLLPKSPKRLLDRYPLQIDKDFDFAAIITAHQDGRFIPPLVDSLLKQHYTHFMIYVIADDCDISTMKFANEKVVLLKPETPLHAKIKSLRYAVQHYKRKHDAVIIFDSDNLAHPKFLFNLNQYFQRGFKVVQANMLSKNLNSSYSKLDAVGHIYHNFLERQVKMELGCTSSILGLGLSIDMDIYNKVDYKNELGGFDKKLQIHLTESVPMIAYAKDVIVYDEKIEDGAAFEKQRTRWIFTYFEYFKENFNFLLRAFAAFNFGRLLFGYSLLRPPMFLTISIAICCMVAGFFIYPLIGWLWIALLLLYAVNFILIITTQSQQKKAAAGLLLIPALALRQFKSLLRIGRARNNFLKTRHQHVVYINDILGEA